MSGELFDLAGRSALVTGASGGLGRHFAHTLARAGAAVVVAARRQASIEAVAADIRAAGGRALAVALDVTDPASCEAAIVAADEAFGGLDILVNNSGIAAPAGALDLEPEDWDRVLDTNLKGAWLMARAFGRRIRGTERTGVIVNVASILAFRVAGQVSAYAASKAGLVHLTEALALELARHRIRVNALAPGYIETDLNRSFFATDAGRAMIARVPQRRLGAAADLDGPLLLLASDASRFMTGTTIVVDGGHAISSL